VAEEEPVDEAAQDEVERRQAERVDEEVGVLGVVDEERDEDDQEKVRRPFSSARERRTSVEKSAERTPRRTKRATGPRSGEVLRPPPGSLSPAPRRPKARTTAPRIATASATFARAFEGVSAAQRTRPAKAALGSGARRARGPGRSFRTRAPRRGGLPRRA
jgi:hypothetical protein